ncbi:uncharacterized protein TEOVI_000491600 [Trypanosoma equiperdum]|uniref:Uncharacterized protein n=1 Tax=Trypanosoma equiperdum TaxID=5694 RepID=A0A1G4I3M1_TRYEQ|nr:hypothetical protein, conserved [Trypanosoma equiperdum]
MDKALCTSLSCQSRPKRCRGSDNPQFGTSFSSGSNVPEMSLLSSAVQQAVEKVFSEHASDVGSELLSDEIFTSSVCRAILPSEDGAKPLSDQELQQRVRSCLEVVLTGKVDEERQLLVSEALTHQLAEVLLKPPPLIAATGVSQEENVQPDVKRVRSVFAGSSMSTVRVGVAPVGKVNSSGSLLPPPAPLSSVFSGSAVYPVRVVAFHNLPSKYCEKEALKEQLAEICARIPHSYYLNVHCVQSKHKAIASFGTKEAAAAVAFIVNTSGIHAPQTDGKDAGAPTVSAQPATEEEQEAVWAPLVEQVKALEESWSSWDEKFRANPPYKLYQEWVEAKNRGVGLDEALQQLTATNKVSEGQVADTASYGVVESGTATVGLTQEGLQKKLVLLQGRLECKKIIERTEECMRELLGDTFSGSLERACSGPTHSTSSATLSNPRKALFIYDLPRPFDDVELVRFLQYVGVEPVHIWRNSAVPTTVCVELPSIGRVFTVLRQLDGTNMKFAGATFSREYASTPQNASSCPLTVT